MQRDIETITDDLREIGNIFAIGVFGEDRERFVARFNELREEQKRARREQLQQWIYFIHAPAVSRIKIGRTTNVTSRFQTLASSSPTQLVLLSKFPGTREDETTLHRRWASLRCHGEWFSVTDELWAEATAVDGPVFDRCAA